MNGVAIYRLLPQTQKNHDKLIGMGMGMGMGMGICGICRYVWNTFLARNKREMALFRAGRLNRKPSVSWAQCSVRGWYLPS